MQGPALIVVFVLAVILMILAISKWKVHPFLALMGISVLLAILSGIPLVDQIDAGGNTRLGIANVIGTGFSGTFTSIGIVIILGALIGTILETTGAAFRLADIVVKVVGPKHPTLAIMLMGWIVSIPVFCDSGFVILNPIRKAIARKTAASGVAMSVALSAGLYASHVFIPPTPGPIAAANTLYESAEMPVNLLLVMGLGAVVSIFALAGSYFYANYIGKKVESAEDVKNEEIVESYEDLKKAYGKIPGGFISFAPILVPIILMAFGSIAAMAGWSGQKRELLSFFGMPVIALAVGVLFSVILLISTKNMDQFYEITNDTLKVVGPILFVTAAGGVLGKVIAESGMVSYITQNAEALQVIGIFFPFLLSAILKTAQGSSTVALTTTAGIVAPLMGVLNLNTSVLIALTTMAIGAGAMTVSHANDSYFWVVTNFGGLTPEKGYKTQTMVTLIEGICSMAGIFVLWLFLK